MKRSFFTPIIDAIGEGGLFVLYKIGRLIKTIFSSNEKSNGPLFYDGEKKKVHVSQDGVSIKNKSKDIVRRKVWVFVPS